MEPSLIFIEEPEYIHKITENLHEFHIETDEDEDYNEDYDDPDPYTWCVMSIDIGIHHLGLSMSLLDEEYNLKEITWIDLINITEYDHEHGLSDEECKLDHTKTFCDWLNHTFQENKGFYEMADYILIERQPPMGFVVIEQLIFSRWREKSILISPNSMHKYFGIGRYDYDQRKECTNIIAKSKITNPHLIEQWGFYHRTHDIADSICIMLFWINRKHEEYMKEERRKRIMRQKIHLETHCHNLTTEEWFEMHRRI